MKLIKNFFRTLMPLSLAQEPVGGGAQLDSAHVGDIRGGFAQSSFEGT
jgi:hypothetical protein